MDIRIKATEYQLTSKTEAYITERVQSLEKLLGGNAALSRVEVEVGRDAGRPRHGANIYFAEIRIIYPGNQSSIYATNKSESINGAIDDVKEEAERQLRKQKRITERSVRKGGAKVKQLLRGER